MFRSKDKKEMKKLKETIRNQNNMIEKLNKSVIEATENAERFKSVNADLFLQNEKLKRQINDICLKSEKDLRHAINVFSPLLNMLGIDGKRYLDNVNADNDLFLRSMELLGEFVKGKKFYLDGVDVSSTFINTDLNTIMEGLAGTDFISTLPGDKKQAFRQLGFMMITFNSILTKDVLESRKKSA